MPKYKVLSKSFIDGCMREEGDEVEHAGLPGANLEPLDDDAKDQAAAAKVERQRLERAASAAGSALAAIDMTALASAIAAAMAAATKPGKKDQPLV